MEGKIAWLIILSFGMLLQALIMALKIIRERSAKKNNPYGERIKGLEVKMEDLEKDFEDFKRENREDHQKFLDKLNRRKMLKI